MCNFCSSEQKKPELEVEDKNINSEDVSLIIENHELKKEIYTLKNEIKVLENSIKIKKETEQTKHLKLIKHPLIATDWKNMPIHYWKIPIQI